MKLNTLKQPGGTLIPASDMDAEQLNKFKSGEMYEVEIKLTRNPAFLRKTMAFFHYCMAHWDAGQVMEHGTEAAQFDRFRKDLTILAGYYDITTRLNGDQRVEAKSLSFASMNEETFRECYQALINAAMKHLFKTETDEQVYSKLAGFF